MATRRTSFELDAEVTRLAAVLDKVDAEAANAQAAVADLQRRVDALDKLAASFAEKAKALTSGLPGGLLGKLLGGSGPAGG